MIEVSDKPHAELGASGWHTWSTCPGSIVLGEGIVSTSSKYAKEGTAAHAVLEKCLLEKIDAETLIGEEIIVEGEVFVCDHEMADAINSCLDIIKSYAGHDGHIFAEEVVPIEHLTGEAGAEGTCDVAVISNNGTVLTIADLKYGQGVQVYASEKIGVDMTYDMAVPNGQLAIYASGWLQLHGFLWEEVEKVRLVVLQPRMEWHDEYEITIEELRSFEDQVREAAGRVELERHEHLTGGSELTLVPGEKQCKFCNAKGLCPALREQAVGGLKALVEPSQLDEFDDLSLPKKAASIVVNEGVTNERLAEFLRAVPLLEAAISAAGEEALRRLCAGQELPGYYLGQGRAGHRRWRSDTEARRELTKSGRLKVAEATEQVVLSPTKIEKLAKGTKWWPKVAPLIEQAPGGPKVCKDGDKNARYQIASEVSEFANLDETPSLSDLMS